MKALEVLKKACVFSERSRHYPTKEEFDMAIDELEALESRSCEGCKHLKYIEKSFKRCDELDINIGHLTWDDFYCAYWEAKQ